MIFSSRKTIMRAALLSTAAGWAIATPAWAQPADADVQENAAQAEPDATGNSEMQEGEQGDSIVVTGSRIQRRDLTSTSPLAVVQDEEFRLSGASNAEQVINTLPQVIPGSTAFNNNPGGGVATLQLRGLGPQRTLLLVNGRRWMYYDTSQITDVNTIPQFLIDSVDVVTGGASAVYGSDAVAGVINFRLQTDLDGLQIGASSAITERGDGARYGINAAYGLQLGDRGHFTVFGEYSNRGSIFQGQRDFARFTLQENAGGTALEPGGSVTTREGRFLYFGGANFNNPNAVGFDDVTFGTPGTIRPTTAADTFNYAPANYLMVPQERWLAGGYGEIEIAPAATVFTELSYVVNRVENELAPTPVTGLFDVQIARACGFVTPATCARLQQLDAMETSANAQDQDPTTPGHQPATDDPGIVNFFVLRRITETGARNVTDEREAYRGLIGLRGALSSALNYEAYYSFTETRNTQRMVGNISQRAFGAGLDGTGTAINIFGPNTLTPAMVSAITIPTENRESSRLQVASASINGLVGNLGMGGEDIGFALGAEWRSVAARYNPDPAMASGDVIGFNAGAPTAGSYDVREVFAELRLPLLADRPGFHRLELSGAARYSDYSLPAVGSVWTYAAGAEWAPVRDITFRGQYQRAIRAPNVDELFAGRSVGYPTAIDPCAQPSAATNAAIRQVCIQTGVPAGLVGDPSIQLDTQIESSFFGNANLEEERADTWTVGMVIRPRFIPRLNITVDGYDIEIDNVISTFGGGAANILRLCYNVFQQATNQYCQAIRRNPNGILSGDQFVINIPNANIARLETRGVDVQVDYSLPLNFSLANGTGGSRLNFFFLGTYVDEFDITPAVALPNDVNRCAGRFGVLACGEPVPQWKWTSRLSLIDGPVTLSGRWRHVGSVQDDDPNTQYFVERIGATDYFDLSFGVDIGESMSLTAGVNNIFDREPTLLGDNQEQSNTWPNTYEVIGRDFFVSARVRF